MAAEETGPPPYTTQNFDAINGYIDHLASRHQARTARWRSETFGTYAKWIALAVAASGAAAFLVLFGLSLFKEKPEPRIVRPVVIDRDVIVKLPEGLGAVQQPRRTDVDQRLSEIMRQIDEIKRGKTGDGTGAQPASPVLNFVIFKEIPFNRAGISNVVIGMRYKDTTSKIPSSQWCYVNKGNLSGTVTRVDLAKKDDKQPIKSTLTLSEAREMRTTLDILRSAQRHCTFE